MTDYLCHEEPDLFEFETEVVDTRPGGVLLDRSTFYPGGGGQLPDHGWLRWGNEVVPVTHIEYEKGRGAWHFVDASYLPGTKVQGEVDRDFRFLMCELHTDLHILNALVFQEFEGALVTGVQMNENGTAHIDFDLPEADNFKIRGLEPVINAHISKGLAVRQSYVPLDEAEREPGVLRSRAVFPPVQPDGTIRVVEIVGLDRQGCGGTHLDNTAQSRPVRIMKVKNKGRHNRRVYLGLADYFGSAR
jgi:misacylated tRNA(Ala) deacylase